MKTIQHEIEDLRAYRRILVFRIRNPRTCPRRAIEAEQEIAAADLKIADLSAKIQTAVVIPFIAPASSLKTGN